MHAGMLDNGELGEEASFGGLLSANRSTLAKMRHLDGVDRHELRRRKAAIGSSCCQRL